MILGKFTRRLLNRRQLVKPKDLGNVLAKDGNRDRELRNDAARLARVEGRNLNFPNAGL